MSARTGTSQGYRGSLTNSNQARYLLQAGVFFRLRILKLAYFLISTKKIPDCDSNAYSIDRFFFREKKPGVELFYVLTKKIRTKKKTENLTFILTRKTYNCLKYYFLYHQWVFFTSQLRQLIWNISH